MPHILYIALDAQGAPPRNVYRVLHANLLRWFAAVDSQLAAEIHDRPVRKPFTVAGLEPTPGRKGWRWRVTLLDDDLLSSVVQVARSQAWLDLNGASIPILWGEAEVASPTYGDLLDHACDDMYLCMAFVSPTTFRAGNLDAPLPEPGAAFHSWLSHWNDFAPPNRHISTALLDVVRECVAIAEIRDLHTERHDLGRSSPVGFVGQVTYVITRARTLNQADVWRLNALAQYAEFCGTGRKTTQGMGQTRRLASRG